MRSLFLSVALGAVFLLPVQGGAQMFHDGNNTREQYICGQRMTTWRQYAVVRGDNRPPTQCQSNYTIVGRGLVKKAYKTASGWQVTLSNGHTFTLETHGNDLKARDSIVYAISYGQAEALRINNRTTSPFVTQLESLM